MIMSFIRRRLTYASVAVTAALVFAMAGGAFAATKYLITSTKQIKPSVLKQLKGKAGPAGKAGLAGKEGAVGKEGPAGKEGPKGANGTNGEPGASATIKPYLTSGTECNKLGGSEFKVGGGAATFACNGSPGANGESVTSKPYLTSGSECNKLGGSEFESEPAKGKVKTYACNGSPGANGESVTSKPLSKGNANCTEGGSEFESEPAKGKVKTYACNGSPWTAGGTLPGGQEEQGSWSITFNAIQKEQVASAPISFPIPLGTAPTPHLLKKGATPTSACPGSVTAPSATIGNLCVYTGEEMNLTPVAGLEFENPTAGIGTATAAKTGVVLLMEDIAFNATKGELSLAWGTWAVKA